MVILVKKLWKKIEITRKKQLFLLLLMMIITSFMEVAGLGAVVPFLAVVTSPDAVFKHSLAQPIISGFELNQPQDLLLPVTILFIVTTILAGNARVSLLWMQI